MRHAYHGSYRLGSILVLIAIWVACGQMFGLYGTIGLPATVIALLVVGCIANSYRDRCSHGVRRNWRGARACRSCDEEHAQRRALEAAEREVREAQHKQKLDEERRQAARLVRTLDHLNRMDPFLFEGLVLWTYGRLGWETRATPRSGDHGIDGILTRGSESVVVQCKRFTTGKIGERVLRDLLGAVVKMKATRGILVTTSDLSDNAKHWIHDRPDLSFVNGSELIQLIERAAGEGDVVPREFGLIPDDSSALESCPRCGKATRVVDGRRGRFLGCSGYPACHWTADLSLGRKRRRFQKRC